MYLTVFQMNHITILEGEGANLRNFDSLLTGHFKAKEWYSLKYCLLVGKSVSHRDVVRNSESTFFVQYS